MRRLATGSVAVCLLLAGCGGDDDTPEDQSDTGTTTTRTAPAPTRAEFIAAADAFCKRANTQAKRLNTRVTRAQQTAADAQSALRAMAPILREGLPFQRARTRALRAIDAPAADQATIDKYLDLATRQTKAIERLADAAKDADVKRFSTVAGEQGRLSKQSDALAKSYGFKECGSRRNEAK